ncbi:MAG: SGNH/GDSL hydrolase family protein [Gemmatimonadota bacterium]|nr:SGNH/GDSL hydrolase family protein [Gemmatimonadota bacterium]
MSNVPRPARTPIRRPSWLRAPWLAATVLAAALLACGATEVPSAPEPDADLALLFIGNSLTYANGLPEIVEALLADATGGTVVAQQVALPNYGLEDHWREGTASAAIARGGWDWVVMQQGPSATEGRPSLLEYAHRFGLEATAVGARPALYMVWPSRVRSFDFDGVAESYAMAADSADGVLFPAGDAWRAAWRRNPQLALYDFDGFHPSVLGTWLAALTIADRIVGGTLDPDFSGAPIPVGVGPLLLEAAREANAAWP